LHAIYTLLDLRHPQRLVPVDPAVAQSMANSALRLSRGGTDMWRAWVGFNFSHSLGILIVGALGVWAGARDRLRLSGSRPTLLVSDSCDRHCHWYRVRRRRMDPIPELTLHVFNGTNQRNLYRLEIRIWCGVSEDSQHRDDLTFVVKCVGYDVKQDKCRTLEFAAPIHGTLG
jgi:hypothetical protein